MKFSVSILAEGDREIELSEVVELADAVAHLGGIASGAGSASYGAQILVEAPDSDQAVDLAVPLFVEAARRASMPDWRVTRAETISEEDDMGAWDQ